MTDDTAEIQAIRRFASALTCPLALVDEGGRILVQNTSFQKAFDTSVGAQLADHCQDPHSALSELLASARKTSAALPGRLVSREKRAFQCEATRYSRSNPDAPPLVALRLQPPGPARQFHSLTEKVVALERAEAMRQRVENDLSLVRARLSAIVEHSPSGICLRDADGRFIVVNAAKTRIWGVPKEDFLGRTMSEMSNVFGDQMTWLEDVDKLVLQNGQAVQEEARVEIDGRFYDLLCVFFPIDDPVTSARSICGITIDITRLLATERARQEMEAQFLHAQKLESLGVFAGGIAHDFNNLLMGVLANAAVASSALEAEPAETLECLADIQTAAHRATDLCRQLLAYSGKGRFVVEPHDASVLVTEMVDLLLVSLSKKTDVDLVATPGLPAISGDASQLRQVVMNLVTNASEALGGQPGTVSVSTELGNFSDDEVFDDGAKLPPGPYVSIRVADTGEGMDQATKDRIFEPFFTTKFTGRGLGLAAVQGIVRAHQGALRVSSTKGEGTVFEAFFPALDFEAAPQAADASSPALQTGVGTILVVDDESIVRNAARRVLIRAGYQVVEAVDGAEAIEIFRKKPTAFQAILLDMTMPVLSGEEVFEMMREVNPRVRVLLSSGYNEQAATAHFVGRDLAGFLQKPYLPHELLDALSAVIEERSQRR